MPFHPTFTGLENAEALIFMDCGGHDRWLLAHDSLANDFRIDTITYGIMNQPAARKQLRGELADILDAHEVREDVMTLRWLRVIAKVHRAHGNTDSFSLAVVKCPRGHDCKLNIATAKNERGAGSTGASRTCSSEPTRLQVEPNQVAPLRRQVCNQRRRQTRAGSTADRSFSNVMASADRC